MLDNLSRATLRILIFFGLILGSTFALAEETTDILGYSKIENMSGKAADVQRQGATIVNLNELNTFFVYWLPEGAKTDVPVMILLHGTNGTAYLSLHDELPMAKDLGYALIALQWHNRQSDHYMQPHELNRQHQGLIDFVVAQAGGIRNGKKATPFYEALIQGKYGASPFADIDFFLYCGEKDEQWGAAMCEHMDEAQKLVTQYGGHVVRFVRDPNGGHMGYKLNPQLQNEAMTFFLKNH